MLKSSIDAGYYWSNQYDEWGLRRQYRKNSGGHRTSKERPFGFDRLSGSHNPGLHIAGLVFGLRRNPILARSASYSIQPHLFVTGRCSGLLIRHYCLNTMYLMIRAISSPRARVIYSILTIIGWVSLFAKTFGMTKRSGSNAFMQMIQLKS